MSRNILVPVETEFWDNKSDAANEALDKAMDQASWYWYSCRPAKDNQGKWLTGTSFWWFIKCKLLI